MYNLIKSEWHHVDSKFANELSATIYLQRQNTFLIIKKYNKSNYKERDIV